MAFLNGIVTKLFGSKYEKDLKELNPIVDLVKSVSPEIEKLSDDELRARTQSLKQKIQDYIADENNKNKGKEKYEEKERERGDCRWRE